MNSQSGKIRIISGVFRGRVLTFPAVRGLRPTPDRVRETLFNWLATSISGARCLDLFAGSGALGFEAASRAASEVVFIESNRTAAKAIKKNCEILNLNVEIQQRDSLSYLKSCKKTFDVVFLDPPYKSNLLQKSINHLDQWGLIRANGWVYVEYSSKNQSVNLPTEWELHRSTKAGDVKADLYNVLN